MVTKRKPPKQNSEQGASAKPARPSVKGKAVARSTERPKTSAARSTEADEGKVSAAGQASEGVSAGQAAQDGKSKRRIAMPQSSTRLKANRASNGAAVSGAAGQPDVGSDCKDVAGAGKPTPRKPTKARKPLSGPSVAAGGAAQGAEDPGKASADRKGEGPQASSSPGASIARRLKRFSVAKADKTAADQAKDLEGKVSADDASAAEHRARASIAADAAKRRLERRQRMMKHAGEGEGEVGKPTDPASAQDGEAEGREGRSGGAKRGRKAPAVSLTWPVVAALAVLAIIVVAIGIFSWGRWLRYDDAADFQGLWYANGTTSVVTVDGQKIHLTDDVAYDYSLDTGAKTITFTFGNMQGQGRYRFSVDRSELVITDGDGFSFWGNLFDDIGWQFGQALSSLQGQEVQREAVVDGVTVLDRTPTQGASSATTASDGAASDASADDGGQEGSLDGEADVANSADGSDAVGAEDDAGGSDDASADGSSDSGFTGAVAEGGIDSAGSNAVTLEQLKSGSLQ